MHRPALLAVTFLLLAAGAVQGQEEAEALDRTTALYLHVNGYQDLAMTTRAPPEGYVEDATLGLATSSLTCLPQPPVVGGARQEYHTQRAFAFTGHVDYAERPARLVMDDYAFGVSLGPDVTVTGGRMTLHWFWSTDAQLPGGAGDPLPLVLPGVVVEATLREGQDINVDQGSWDTGRVLAHGRTEPAVLAGERSTGATYSSDTGRPVYGFEVPLDVVDPILPTTTGYNLRIDTYVLRDECPAEGYLTPNALAVHTSKDHRPRLEFTADDQPTIEGVRVAPLREGITDRIVVAANVTSPWGNADVADVQVAIRSLDGDASAGFLLPFGVPTDVHCHCPPTPIQAAWVWDAGMDRAPPGRYVATITATSVQGTQTVVEHEFSLASAKEAPGTPAVLLLAGLALLAAALRRP